MDELQITNTEQEVHRYDASPLETKFDTTPEGFLTGTAVVTRIGVFPYMMKDGTVRFELRHPDDVFHQDSLSTYTMKPITNDHPKVGLVNVSNSKEFVVGSTGSTTIHNDAHLAIPIVVHDSKTIADIKNGKRELSCGYKCDVIPESGVWNGISYTHKQVNIRTNHVAVVKAGRAGTVARIRLDGALAPIDIENAKENTMDETLKTIQLDSVDYQADAKVIEALQSAQTLASETQTKLDSTIAEKSKMEADKDSLQEKFDALGKELEAIKANHVDADKVTELVKSRVAVEAFATKAGVEFKADMADIDIKKAVILKEAPHVSAEKLADVAYLTARYDSIVEDWDLKQKAKEDADVRKISIVKTDSTDAPRKTYDVAKAEYIQSLQNAHKQ